MIYTKDEKSALKSIKVLHEKRGSREHSESNPSLKSYLEGVEITNKNDLLEYSQHNIDQILSHSVLFSETSGTTGKPLMTPRYSSDLNWNINNQILAYKKHLNPNTDRVAILHPGILSPFLEASAMALKGLDIGYVRIFPIEGICDYQRIVDILNRYEITSIMSTPSLIYKLYYEINCKLGSTAPRFVNKLLVTGERLSLARKSNIERIAPGAKALPFVYGSSEVATTMIGEEPFGYRPILDDFVFEVIDSESKPIENYSEYGEIHSHGKLLITWLRKGALPIIRYDTNDIFTVIKDHSGNHLFFNEGRHNLNIEERNLENAVENSIYSLGIPVYHFYCHFDKNELELKVAVVIDPKEKSAQHYFQEAISKNVPSNLRVSVTIDRDNSNFFNFSPKPKQKTFTAT